MARKRQKRKGKGKVGGGVPRKWLFLVVVIPEEWFFLVKGRGWERFKGVNEGNVWKEERKSLKTNVF